MHFHSWDEYKNITNGTVEYYRICRKCGKAQKWLGGGYWDFSGARTNNWQLITDDDNFDIEYE